MNNTAVRNADATATLTGVKNVTHVNRDYFNDCATAKLNGTKDTTADGN